MAEIQISPGGVAMVPVRRDSSLKGRRRCFTSSFGVDGADAKKGNEALSHRLACCLGNVADSRLRDLHEREIIWEWILELARTAIQMVRVA